MTLPIVIPAQPSAGNSPASMADDSSVASSNPPRTPVSPTAEQAPTTTAATTANPASSTGNAANNKRKPSRRANTAERRATHNAVERQRRETLNGRFLDLAALLPNLSQIRRPSKSSIVNSSIAHIHASRRHRLLASRELRILKLECDALRRELNEWRDRAGIPRIEEPVRGEGFSMVLSGELEVLVVPGMVGGIGIEDDEDEYPGAPSYPQEEEVYSHPMEAPESEDPRIAMVKTASAHPFAPSNGAASPASNASSSPPYPHRPSITIAPQQPIMSGPIIASPTAMSFENPAMAGVYSTSDAHIPHPHQTVMYHPQGFPVHPHQMGGHQIMDAEKVAHWNMIQQQAMMRNPNPDQAYLASLARRERSASMSAGSRSSGSASPVQQYDVPPFDGPFEPAFEGQWSHGGGLGGRQQPVFAMMM